MSFGIIVMHFACSAHRFDCSSRPIRKVSPVSCRAITAVDCSHKSSLTLCMISLTTLWKGNLWINNSVPLCYFQISLNAFKPLLFLFIFSPSVLSFPPFTFFSSFFPVIFLALLFPPTFSLCTSGCLFHFSCHL